MIDPIYATTLIVGGSTHKYAFTALPYELLADQSMELSVTISNADSSPFDLSGSTAEFFCTARNVTGLIPTSLGSATLSDSGSGTVDTVSIVVPKDGIPDFLGDYTPTRTGSSVFYFQIQDADSYIQIYQYVNVTASDFSGNGSGNIELPSSSLLYTPSDGADWPDPDPSNVEEGLDELASRVQDIEDNPSSGDMNKTTYDPQLIEADAFDRGNHTGTQTSATISDLDTTINANTGVSGTVTIHTDVNSAGRGDIITSSEGALVADYDNHRVAVNPHNITPAIVGNTTAQWNADQIQGYTAPIPTGVTDDQKAIVYDDTTGQFLLATMPGQGGGEANDLVLLGTGESIRVSKVGTDINIKGITGTGTIAVTTVSDNIQIDLPVSAEGVVGGVALANATNVSNLDNDVAISPFRVADMVGDKADSDLAINSAVADYTLLTGDKNAVVEITNSITIPVLTAGYSCLIYNSSATASAITVSGTTIDNTTDLNISAKGSMSIIYLSTTRVIVDGNTEA